jgi:predicted nicotinamide N-methyase
MVLIGDQNRGRLTSEAALLEVGFPVQWISNSGHSQHIDNPEEFYRAAEDFLLRACGQESAAPAPVGGDGSFTQAEPQAEPVESSSLRVLQLDGAVGELRIDEPYWSDDPEARGAGTGATLWDGSVLLARHLMKLAATPAGRPRLAGLALELGAGCSGVPSLVAARLGCFAEVIATDGGDESVEQNLVDLQRNLDANGASDRGSCPDRAVSARRLEWGAGGLAAEFGPVGCILAAEVVYEPASVPLLLRTLRDLSGLGTLVLMFVSERESRSFALFWEQMPALFSYERVGPTVLSADATVKERQLGLFELTLRDL